MPKELRVELTDRQAFMMASMILYFLAIYVGTLESDDVLYEASNLQVTQFTLLWAAFAAATVVTFIMAFRLSWRYAFWFAGAYVCQLIGVTIYLFSDSPGALEFLLAAFMVFLSFAILFSFIWRVKDLRDMLLADTRIVIEYTPLGLWTLQILAAGAFLMASLIAFLQWTEEGGDLTYYLLYQVVFYGTLLYSFALPEKLAYVLENQVPEELRRTKEFTPSVRKKALREAKKEIPMDTCPLCGSHLMSERRTCPSCGASFNFTWCPTSEEYIIHCPYCNLLTPYGRERCIHCERDLRTSIRCPTCEVETPLSEWPAVE